jgi:hypothetical protein
MGSNGWCKSFIADLALIIRPFYVLVTDEEPLKEVAIVFDKLSKKIARKKMLKEELRFIKKSFMKQIFHRQKA